MLILKKEDNIFIIISSSKVAGNRVGVVLVFNKIISSSYFWDINNRIQGV